MSELLAYFHFLRPVWLAALPLIVVLWVAVRRTERSRAQLPAGIAPHLAAALQVSPQAQRRLTPVDGVLFGTALLALAAAGPSWTRVPNPLLAGTAPLVVALKVTPSMEDPDLAPSRLERARFKLLDLVQSRAGGRTALVAYAGSAHRAAPLTEDANILKPLLESLSPQVMPVNGDAPAAALEEAADILSAAQLPGAVLFVLDDFNPADTAAFTALDRDGPAVFFLIAGPASLTIPQLNQIPGARIIHMTPDDADLSRIEQWLDQAYVEALAGDDRLKWADRGWCLALPAAFLCLIWFRPGWTMRWALAAALVPLLSAPQAQADGLRDWFMTPDQQGQLAMNRKEFAAAADSFTDPHRKAHALMKSGQYVAAADIFARTDSYDAAMGEGISRIRNREYREGIAAYERALTHRPGDADAQSNLATAREILEYIETTREQSDTGEDTGIGADDIVFDNEDGRGTDTDMEAAEEDTAPQTADQWIASIDTQMGDFLRLRFLTDTGGKQ